MLNLLFRDTLSLGLARAGVTALLAMAVAYGVRWWGIKIERKTAEPWSGRFSRWWRWGW